MLRREFIAMSLASAGGLMIGRNCLYADAAREISQNLKSTTAPAGYDLIIKGAGIAGVFAAVSAARKGLKVLVADVRPNPAFEIASKYNLSLKIDGFDKWDDTLKQMFFPEGEDAEASNGRLQNPMRACMGDEMLLFAGSVKKSFMRALAVNGVDAMFMTDVFGLYSDDAGNVAGAALATKQGTFRVNCTSFIDADDNSLFTRDIAGQMYKIESASFAAEFDGAKFSFDGKLELPAGIAVKNPEFRRGRGCAKQCYISFEIPVENNDVCKAERDARKAAFEIAKSGSGLHADLKKIFLRSWALETTLNVVGDKPKAKFGNYYVLENAPRKYSCRDILEIREEAQSLAGYVSKSARGKTSKLNLIGAAVKAGEPLGKPVEENGQILPLYPLDASELPAKEIASDVFVAGIGTAGVFAASSAAEHGAKVFGAEYFNDFGGTKTAGGVVGYYWGLKDHPVLKDYEADVRNLTKDYAMLRGVARAALNSELVKNCEIATSAIICGAKTSGENYESTLVCSRAKLLRIKSKVAIDCTADGDLAAFAKLPFISGDARAGLSPNYSQWNMHFRGKRGAKDEASNKDYDILDTSKISDLQRGFFISYYEANYYNFYPFLTVRELRRPEGAFTLNLRDALEGTSFKDTIAQAYSDYDPHNYPTGKFSRTAMMVAHYTNKKPVNIPYGCITPKSLDGLLLCGRGISVSHDVYQYTRMSADVQVLGYIEGEIAAEQAKTGVKTRAFDVSSLQKKWIEKDYFTKDFGTRVNATVDELVARLAKSDDGALIEICLKPKPEVFKSLEAAYANFPTLALAQALAWFGDPRGEDAILRDLKENFANEQKNGHPADYVELYSRGNLHSAYWNINRDIAFLAFAGTEKSDAAVAEILSKTTAGGPPVRSPVSYIANRIDQVLVPFYNRIGNLCFYAERRPNAGFAEGFDRLLDDKNIAGGNTEDYTEARWHAYKGILEILVSSAGARCGSKKGAKVLANYLTDQHAFLREFSRRDLADIFGKDAGFAVSDWEKLAESSSGARKPISKEFDETC